jgi:hypothetical protein
MKKLTTYSKKILFVFFLISSVTVRAQWVTIPDPNFVTYLTAMFPSCMSGNQMDTTCGPITWQNNVNVAGLSINDLSGIQYFDGLLYLDCSNNLLTSLPPLPHSLVSLTASSNQLTSLPALPASLTNLACNYNNLTTLPAIPSGVTSLYAISNNINTVPALPPVLNALGLQQNNLSTLPTLPNSLSTLIIGFNNFSVMPTLPPNLTQLTCGNNLLTSIPSLPSTLTQLECINNSITSLPALPNGLQQLHCYDNPITSLPSLPNSLLQLTINNCPMTCLPELPNGLYYLYMNGSGITCMPNYPASVTNYDINPYTLPLCQLSSGCPIGYNISGRLYFDANLDCNYAVPENLLTYIPVQLYQSGILVGQSFNYSGYYGFNTSLSGYDVIVDTTGIPFDMSCGFPGIDTNVVLTALDSIADDLDFGFKCKPGYDIAVNSVMQTGGIFFPNQFVAVYSMAGDLSAIYNGSSCNTSGISGTVQITVTGPATYVAPAPGSLTPSVAGNVFTYTIPDFSMVNPILAFGVIISTDVTATIGDQVCFDVVVSSSGTENNLTNNTIHHCFPVVNSYDPNVKEVSPIGDLLYPFNNWLTYTIHFQNTGNAPAMNIRIADVLDADLDPSTFRLLNASHNVQVDIMGSNVQFRFNDIMLPDSTSNSLGSLGFVQYKIKPDANLSAGTVLNNTANIYFDFNTPITTNTTTNNIVVSGIGSEEEATMEIFPNPATDFITVKFSDDQFRMIQLLDMYGRMIIEQAAGTQQSSMYVGNLAGGIYLFKIVEGNKEMVKRIVINR